MSVCINSKLEVLNWFGLHIGKAHPHTGLQRASSGSDIILCLHKNTHTTQPGSSFSGGSSGQKKKWICSAAQESSFYSLLGVLHVLLSIQTWKPLTLFHHCFPRLASSSVLQNLKQNGAWCVCKCCLDTSLLLNVLRL